MFYGITDITTYILGTLVIVLLPGPNSLYVMSIAARKGIATGYRGAFGIFLGDAILMVLSATGAASLLMTTPALFMVIKYAGAAYLAWMGVGLIISACRKWRGGEQIGDQASLGETKLDTARPFQTALIISLMNPKAILFFVSFFIQFVDPAYPHPALSFLILAIIVQICSAAYLSLLIFGGVRLADAFRRKRRTAAAATGGVGSLFIGFGAKLANASLA